MATFVYRSQFVETKSESEKQIRKKCPTDVNTKENVPSSEAVASISTGEMAINYSRHLYPQAKKCWSVIVTSCLPLLIAYFSLQTSVRMEHLEENFHR